MMMVHLTKGMFKMVRKTGRALISTRMEDDMKEISKMIWCQGTESYITRTIKSLIKVTGKMICIFFDYYFIDFMEVIAFISIRIFKKQKKLITKISVLQME